MFARIGDLLCRCVKNGHQYALVSRQREAEKYGLKKEGKYGKNRRIQQDRLGWNGISSR